VSDSPDHTGKPKPERQPRKLGGKPPGRPTLYREEYDEWALKLCRLGATNEELAESFDVSVSTIDLWIAKHDGFSGAVKEGRRHSDAAVADRLFKRATGYSHDAVHIMNNKGMAVVVPYVKHYAPDTLAAIFWLKNRRPDLWRDRSAVEHSGPGGGPIQTEGEFRPTAEDEEVIRRIRDTRENIQTPQQSA